MALLVLVTVFSLIANYQMPAKEDKWRTYTVYNDSVKFVQIELQDQKPVIGFSSDEGTVMLQKKGSTLPVYSSFQKYMTGQNWRKQIIDESGNTGSYLSMKNLDGGMAFAYQDSSVGNEKLFYTTKNNDNWTRERIDWAAGTGLGTGMYAALTQMNGEPVIFYHTSQGRKFVKAERNEGSWNREVLETGVGWFTSADSCGSKVFVLYRDRNSDTLYKGEFDGSWNSENISGSTDSTTSIDATDCEFKAAYYNTENEKVVYRQSEQTETIGDGKLSRTSLVYQGYPKISYRIYGEGLMYAEKNETGWSTESIDNRTYAGGYNDLAVSENGKKHIAYTQDDKVVYATYGTEGYRALNNYTGITSAVLVLITLISSTVFWREGIIETVSEFLS